MPEYKLISSFKRSGEKKKYSGMCVYNFKHNIERSSKIPIQNLLMYSLTAIDSKKTHEQDKIKTTPIILVGDFNINFNTEDGNNLIRFLKETWNFEMSNDRNLPTTKNQTCIDAVFSNNINKITTMRYISYFSHHRPLLSSIS